MEERGGAKKGNIEATIFNYSVKLQMTMDI